MTSGLSALLLPLTQQLVKECVTVRTNLRSTCLPSKFYTIKEKFLKNHPFHPSGMGEVEAVCTLIESVPTPLKVTLPKDLEKAIQQKVTRYDNNQSTSFRKPTYKDRQGSTNVNNYKNKSPVKRRRQESPHRKDDDKNSSNSKSSEYFRDSRPKRGNYSGRGSSNRSKSQ